VIALIDHLGLESVSYFGWSTGVLVGLRAAEQHSGVFGSLILFGPLAPPATVEQLAERARQRTAALRERGWWLLLDGMLPAEKLPVPQWMIDRILATDIEPFIGWSQARPTWNWSPWDALPHINISTLMLVGELEDPEDSMGRAASVMPCATRVLIAEREHINAFLASELVVPIVTEFLNAQGGNAAPTAR
jgi:pimeloyl-ACP methyl ester carboxylesterase